MQLDIDYYKSRGIKIGKNMRTFSSLICAEPYLLSFGDNVTISSDVTFIPHDNSVSKIIKGSTDVFGKISIGNNCFLGHGTIVLPGVKLGDNVIVGAGSVVTKSFEEGNVIIAGNPAKVICTTDEYGEKIRGKSISTNGLSYTEKMELLLNLPEEKFLSK